jgi:hypothetical protein
MSYTAWVLDNCKLHALQVWIAILDLPHASLADCFELCNEWYRGKIPIDCTAHNTFEQFDVLKMPCQNMCNGAGSNARQTGSFGACQQRLEGMRQHC